MIANKLASKMAIVFAAQLLCTCTAKEEDLASMPDVCSSSGESRACDLQTVYDTQLLHFHTAEAAAAYTFIGNGICTGHDADWTSGDNLGPHWGLHGGLGWRMCDSRSDEACQSACDSAPGCTMISNSGCCFLFKGSSCVFDGIHTSYVSYSQQAATPAPADGNVLNDPHVTNLARERFDINQPATYVMLRMPMEPQKTAKFEMRALMQADGSKPCGLYMKAVMLNGSWFGDAVVQVRPLKRDREGSNGAGSKTEWPFSVQTSPEGPWKSFAELQGEGGVVALTDMVKITAEQKADLGDLLEAQTVSVSIGKKGKPASIVVSQAQHQALNMELVNMQALGNGAIGGLLGTEKHSKGVEQLTEACKEFKAAEKADEAVLRVQRNPDASRLSASWA